MRLAWGLAVVAVRAAAACIEGGAPLLGDVPLLLGWTQPPAGMANCADPTTCTALLPDQLETRIGEMVLTLSQTRCFAGDGSNRDACCPGGNRCAAWAGATVSHEACTAEGVVTVHATLEGSRSVATVAGARAVEGHHRYSIIHAQGWTATAVDGVLASNVSDAASAWPLQLTIGTAHGSAPLITFSAPPPGAAKGAAAAFSVGAGAVYDEAGVRMHTNTVDAVTVVVPAAAMGVCAPCPTAPAGLAAVFATTPATAALLMGEDVTLRVTSIRVDPLDDATLESATTPTPWELAEAALALADAAVVQSVAEAQATSEALAGAAMIAEQQAKEAVATTAVATAIMSVLTASPPPPAPSMPASAPNASTTQFDVALSTPSPNAGQTYAGTAAVPAGSPISDANLSAAMSAALGVPTTAVSTAHCTVVTLYKAVAVADATAAALQLAAAVGATHVPFQLTSANVRFIAPLALSNDAAAKALGYTLVAAVPAVCVDVYVAAAKSPADMGPAMGLLQNPIAVATDSAQVGPAPMDHGSVSEQSRRVMLGVGVAALVVVVVAIALMASEVVIASRTRRSDMSSKVILD